MQTSQSSLHMSHVSIASAFLIWPLPRCQTGDNLSLDACGFTMSSLSRGMKKKKNLGHTSPGSKQVPPYPPRMAQQLLLTQNSVHWSGAAENEQMHGWIAGDSGLGGILPAGSKVGCCGQSPRRRLHFAACLRDDDAGCAPQTGRGRWVVGGRVTRFCSLEGNRDHHAQYASKLIWWVDLKSHTSTAVVQHLIAENNHIDYLPERQEFV